MLSYDECEAAGLVMKTLCRVKGLERGVSAAGVNV